MTHKKSSFHSFCFHALWITNSLFVFFLSFGSALHSYGFRAFSTSQTEGLLLICSVLIIVIINICNASIFLHHKVKLFNLLLLLALQHKFAPRAPPRLVPKKEVKRYGLFCLVIVCGVVQLDLMLLFLFCFCSEVVENAEADANQAKDLLRRFNVTLTSISLVSLNYFAFLWFYIFLVCCVGECYEGKEQGWEKRFAMLLKFSYLIIFVFYIFSIAFLFFSLLEINQNNSWKWTCTQMFGVYMTVK